MGKVVVVEENAGDSFREENAAVLGSYPSRTL